MNTPGSFKPKKRPNHGNSMMYLLAGECICFPYTCSIQRKKLLSHVLNVYVNRHRTWFPPNVFILW